MNTIDKIDRILLSEKSFSDEEVIALIRKNCSQYLKEDVTLYRGYKAQVKFFEKTPRTNRRPKDLPFVVHEALDEMFNKKFKWSPRSEGVFCSPDTGATARYGTTYFFFPFDGYKYLWNPGIRDLFDSVEFMVRRYFKELQNKYEHESVYGIQDFIGVVDDNEFKTLISMFTDKNLNSYSNKNLKKNDRNEVMVKCKKYYMADFQEYYSLLNRAGLVDINGY
jgi:hypothetical protein